MANTQFISSAVRIRSPPKRRISAERNDNGNTASIYFVQHKVVPCKSETLFEDDILFPEEKTLYVNGESCYPFDNLTQNGKRVESAVDNSIELDFNSNVILENKTLTFNQSTTHIENKTLASNQSNLQVENMIDLSDHTPPASFDKMYKNGRILKLGESNSELNRSMRPAKPKRTLKFDRDRCTFIEGSSVDDVTTNVPFLQKELDAFIQSEKHKFSGVVEECFDASMTSIDPGVSFNELAPWIRNVYLEKLQAHMSKVDSKKLEGTDNKEELTLQLTDKKETCEFLNHSLPSLSPVKTFPSKDFYSPNSERKPKKDGHTNPSTHVKEVAKLLDSQIEQLQILLADINCNEIDTELSPSETTKQSFIDLSPTIIESPTLIEPNRRTELPRLPDEKRNSKILWLNPDGIRSTMTNLKHRFSRISDSKIRKFSFQQSKRKSDGCLRYSNSHLQNDFVCKTSPKQISKAFDREHDSQMKNESDFQKKQIEEERLRLSELKRLAAEKAELEWSGKKKDFHEQKVYQNKESLEAMKLKSEELELKSEEERRFILAEMENINKQETLLKQREQEMADLKIERERREELEKILFSEKENENFLERSLFEEKERLNTLEKSFAEERLKRVEIERRLQEEEERNRNYSLDKKKSEPISNAQILENNGTLKRRLPSYTLSVRSGQLGNDQELNLLQHLIDAGHSIENSPAVRINRYSCRGYLLKMGHRFNISWKKRWFVFDRKLRALCYYQDEWKTKSKGILYFQSIQEVYVDNGVKRSPNAKTTFCIRTPQRTYVLNAPTPIVMSIWIDVIITGREGGLMSMTL